MDDDRVSGGILKKKESESDFLLSGILGFEGI